MTIRNFQATSPVDILAAVPVLMGFHPTESVVLLTFTKRHASFNARVDLPSEEESWAVVAETLREAAVKNRVRSAVLVIYSEHPDRAEGQAWEVVKALRAGQVQVIDAIRANGSHYWPALDIDAFSHGGFQAGPGTAYDVSAHPLTVASVLDGRVVLPARDSVAASIDHDPTAAEQVQVELIRLADSVPEGYHEAESLWLRVRTTRYLRDHMPLDAKDAARAIWSIFGFDAPMHAIGWLSRSQCDRATHLWIDLVRRAPLCARGDTAAVLAMVSWLAGNGALSWCAVEVCNEFLPGHPLAMQVTQLLQGAVDPRTWFEDDAVS